MNNEELNEELTLTIITLHYIYHKKINEISSLLNININDIKEIVEGLDMTFKYNKDLFVNY